MDASEKYRKDVHKKTKLFLRTIEKKFLGAFSFGFDDGAGGKEFDCPTPTADDSLTYAVQLLFYELYKKGFACGKEVN